MAGEDVERGTAHSPSNCSLDERLLPCETLPVSKIVFLAGVILAASGLVSPAIALLGGLIYGLTLAHPFQAASRDLTKFLLPASVVALGFGMNLHEVLEAGAPALFTPR